MTTEAWTAALKGFKSGKPEQFYTKLATCLFDSGFSDDEELGKLRKALEEVQGTTPQGLRWKMQKQVGFTQRVPYIQ